MSSLQETLGDGVIQFLPCRRFAAGSGDKGNQKCRKGPTENIRELRRRKERGRVGKFTEQGCQVPGLDGARQAGVGSGGGGRMEGNRNRVKKKKAITEHLLCS